jgi:hypothetical protein
MSTLLFTTGKKEFGRESSDDDSVILLSENSTDLNPEERLTNMMTHWG